MRPYLSIVIPCFNEAHRLSKSFTLINKFINKCKYKVELIFVDDGSKDKTANLIEAFITNNNHKNVKTSLIKLKQNTGKGAAVKKGILSSNGKSILFTDADLSVPLSEIDNLLEYINRGYDFILGSREINKSKKRGEPLWRSMIGMVYRFILHFVGLKGEVKDTQCGFKMFSSKAAKQLFKRQRLNGGSFDVELIFISRLLGLNYIEIPVIWTHVPGSTINVFHDAINHPVDIIKIYYYYLNGYYQ